MLSLPFLAIVATGLAAVVRRGDSEHVVLADCKAPNKDYFQSSQMAYYAGPPNNAPDAIANVTYGKQQAWAGSGKITGVFSDNIGFTVNIPATVGEGQFAGIGHNGYADFSCYARFKTALYTTKDGTVCNGIYDCDRTNPPVSSSSPVASTAPSSTPTTPLPPTPTPTTLSTLTRANNNEGGANTSSEGPTGPPAADSTSTQPGGGPSSSSSTAPAATPPTGHSDAPDTGHGEGLTKDQQVNIGVGVGVGVGLGLPALVVAVLAWWFPKTRNMGGQSGRAYQYLQEVVTKTKKRTKVTY